MLQRDRLVDVAVAPAGDDRHAVPGGEPVARDVEATVRVLRALEQLPAVPPSQPSRKPRKKGQPARGTRRAR